MARKETNYESMVSELNEIVKQLENGDLTLEESIKSYENGVKIVNKLYKKLSTLEGKIKVEKINDIEAVYSLPYYFCELGVTNKIITLSIENFQTINSDISFEISSFESKNNIKFADSQKDAILGAFENGIEIITGGPGTGKTTIIKCIIEIYENNGMKVLLAAPTGRAAKE